MEIHGKILDKFVEKRDPLRLQFRVSVFYDDRWCIMIFNDYPRTTNYNDSIAHTL